MWRPTLTSLLGLAGVLTCAPGCGRGEDADGGEGAGLSSGARPSAPPVVPMLPPSASAPPALPVAPSRLVVVAGGDVNLARELGQKILKDPEGTNPFHGIAPVVADADLFFVNLECQLSDQGGETQSPHNRLVFTGPPGGGGVLARAGVDLVSLANNHMWDYGKKALFSTFDELERAGVAYVGASREPDRMYEPTIVRRGDWSTAWFAVTHIWNQGAYQQHEGQHHVAWARFDILAKKLERARREHDVVILSYHGGSEYVDLPMGWTREFADVVMRTGVDAFIGHHPHVPQGVGWRRGRPLFYSLGNFVFRMHRDHEMTGQGYLARLVFERPAGCRARKCTTLQVEACPYHILGDDPLPVTGEGAEARQAALGRRLARLSRKVGGSDVGPPGPHGCAVVTPPTVATAALAAARGGTPVAGPPRVGGSPVSGSPVGATPVGGSPVSGSPVGGSLPTKAANSASTGTLVTPLRASP